MKVSALKTGANKTGAKMLRNGNGKCALKCFEPEVKSTSGKGIPSSQIQKNPPPSQEATVAAGLGIFSVRRDNMVQQCLNNFCPGCARLLGRGSCSVAPHSQPLLFQGLWRGWDVLGEGIMTHVWLWQSPHVSFGPGKTAKLRLSPFQGAVEGELLWESQQYGHEWKESSDLKPEL